MNILFFKKLKFIPRQQLIYASIYYIDLQMDSVGTCCQEKEMGATVTRREHFNYLRNNSCGIWGAFTWQTAQIGFQALREGVEGKSGDQRAGKELPATQNKGNRHVSFDNSNPQPQKQSQTNPKPEKQNKSRPASASLSKSKQQIARTEQAEKQKSLENRQKIASYIEEQKPYSRGLSNTKFQDYFGKPAPECYGRVNINQPIGGVVYGNHMKTFNMNPHVYTNNPEYYQTHTTALNYGKRGKICQDQRWKRLQKQLGKKLGLKFKNQSIKQGKQIAYIDIDDTNKYETLSQNHKFQKQNKQQIHNLEQAYKQQQQQLAIDRVNDYYATKKQKIADNLTTRATVQDFAKLTTEQYEAKLNQQPVYRYHHKQGNVRLAVDRHGITCFVDRHFLENQPVYQRELKGRMKIHPVKVEDEDRNIDAIRKQNCKKGKQEVYPPHYFLRNCEQPEVIKMLSQKTGIDSYQRRSQSQSISQKAKKVGVNSPTQNLNKSLTSTTHERSPQNAQRSQQEGADPARIEGMRANKSEIMERVWGNRQLAGDIAGTMNQECKIGQYLPQNQLNPQCYRGTDGPSLRRVPFAG